MQTHPSPDALGTDVVLARPAGEMPASFRARLDAAISRPTMLDPSAVEAVRAAGAFKPRAEAGGPVPEMFAQAGDVAVVTIEGPLAQRAWSCWDFSGDGYDSITERVAAALADKRVAAVVMRIDSPGGEVAGCFEAVRAIQTAGKASGKPIVAYADELMASAAYALACGADAIVAPDTAIVGSIGVISVIWDRVEANKKGGLNVQVIRSGDLKGGPHPDAPINDQMTAHVQGQIDALAQVFAQTVKAARPIKAPLSLDGAVFIGADALKQGLIDRVGNFADALNLASELAASRKPTGRTKASTTGASMQNIATALGLKEDATESDILAAIHKNGSDHARTRSDLGALLASVGKTDPAEALGAIEAIKASAARTEQAEAKVLELTGSLEQRERDELIAQGVSDGKITPAMKADADWQEMVAKMSVGGLRVYVRTLARVIPLGEEVKTVAKGAASSSTEASLDALKAKGWAGMTSMEKHRLYHEDREAYDQLRADAEG